MAGRPGVTSSRSQVGGGQRLLAVRFGGHGVWSRESRWQLSVLSFLQDPGYPPPTPAPPVTESQVAMASSHVPET